MKGWQNFKIICQKVNCLESQLKIIDEFEFNPYMIRNQQSEDGFIQYKIPYDECVSLNDLYDAIKYNYVVIFKAQAILIIQAILQHLYQMIEKKITHYSLNLNNIFVKLNKESNQFTIYQSILQIEKIYFVQYFCITKTINEHESNSKDIKDIKKIISQFLGLYKDERIFKLIEDLKKVKNFNELKHFKEMNELIDKFIRDFVDLSGQTMKENELENYNSIKKQRYYCEKDLLIYLNEILNLKIQFGKQIVDPTQQEIQEENNYLQKTQYIQQFFLSYFQPLFVKQFQQYYGDKLQNSYLITGIKKQYQFELIHNQIEKVKQKANYAFQSIDKVIKECFNQSNLIKEKQIQDFKFQIDDLSQDKIIEIFLKFFIKHSLEQNQSKLIQNQDQLKQEPIQLNNLSQGISEIDGQFIDEQQFEAYDLTKKESYEELNEKVQIDVINNIKDHYEMELNEKQVQMIDELL